MSEMSIQRLSTAFISLAATTSLAAGELPRAAAPVPGDPVAQTMTTMRMVSALLMDQLRRDGVYPLADERLRRVQEIVGSQQGPQTARLTRDGWGHPLWYRAGGAAHQLISYGS